jgi:hypothetical protein
LVLTFLAALGLSVSDAQSERGQTTMAWTETQAAFCRYDVDVSQLNDPHLRLRDIGQRSVVVCPFASSKTTTVTLFKGTANKTTCEPADLPGFHVVDVKPLTFHDFNTQRKSCMATYSTSEKQAEPGPGKVYVIVSKDPAGLASADIFGRVAAVAQYGGLPIHSIRSEGVGNGKISTDYLCMEMTADADIDPLVYLQSVPVSFSSGTREVISPERNCFQAIMALEHTPRATVAAVMADMASPPFSAFGLSILASSSSPIGQAFDDAFLGSLADVGLPHDFRADGGFYSLVPNDPRPLVIESVRPDRVDFEIAHLSNQVCNAAFTTMGKTQGFIRPPDDESPTIVLKGTSGGPPPRYHALAIQFVATPGDLCAALKPAFDRWAANQATLDAGRPQATARP